MSIKSDLISLECIGYSNYLISRGGNVFKRKSGWQLASNPDGKGYCRTALYKDGKAKTFFTHRLVAMAFIYNPNNKPCINHINGIKNDNRVENLEWCTQSENNLHSFRVLDSTLRKKKMSDAAKNRLLSAYNNPMFGRVHSETSKEKMRINHLDFTNDNHPKAKPVMCIETGEIFRCAKLASLFLGLNKQAISIAIGKQCKAAKLSWRYTNEYKA